MKRCTESRAFGVLGALVAFAAVPLACGRNHDGLALKPDPTGGSGGSGVGGTGGSGAEPHAGRGGLGVGGSATGGFGAKPSEPQGRSVTSFFHGIVDAERVAFCFARHDEAEPVLVGEPRPEGGLAYTSSFAVESIRGIDLSTTPVLPYVIAGELDLVDDLNCEQAVQLARDEMSAVTAAPGAGGAGGEAGGGGNGGTTEPPGPRLRVATLPEIPTGALADGYSSLYVAVGCLGGDAALVHALDDEACGRGYTPSAPTASAVLVTLSRAHAAGKLALQALHASLALPALTVSSAPPDTAVQASVPVAYNLQRGVISPRQPSTQLTLGDFGVELPGWRAQASIDGTVVISNRWNFVLGRAGIDAFEAGRGYTLVAVGPRGDIGARGFWNPGAIGLVDNDPAP
jgi:hypothetical protein